MPKLILLNDRLASLLSYYGKCKKSWIKAQLHTKVWDVTNFFLQQLNIAEICVLNHPKNVSHYIKYLEKTLKICEFFQKICISDFARNGLKMRAALPWLSGRVLFLFWCLNSVLPQQSFIIYLPKVTSRTNVWTFLALVATFNHLKVAKSEITLHFT